MQITEAEIEVSSQKAFHVCTCYTVAGEKQQSVGKILF